MKNCLFLACLLSVMNLSSQPFFDSSVHYLTVHCAGPTPAEFGCSDNYYRMTLDSVSGDTEFYTRSNLRSSKELHDNKFKVIHKKVFIHNPHQVDPGDYLLYDFSLAEGDTAWVNGFGASFIQPNSLLRVDSIRPIKLGPFLYRAFYVSVGISPYNYRLVFVEHIGSLENGLLFYQSREFESGSTLVALCKNDTLMQWQNSVVVKSGHNTCHPEFVSGIQEEFLAKTPFIFPNPSHGLIQIKSEFLSGEAPAVEVYNMAGQLLLKTEVKEDQVMDVGGISKGLYVIKLITGSGRMSQMVLIE
jgi:hypothetical protein